MDKIGVETSLRAVRSARGKWNQARREFDKNVDLIMARLLHEAAANMMSVHDVSMASGLTTKRVRALMRALGMNPHSGKKLLADQAAKALHENAELMGVNPREFDLMSPLAYLPMGKELRMALKKEGTTAPVMELDDDTAVSGNLIHGINYWDDEIGCGHLAYNDPVLVTSDIAKITCDKCRIALVEA